MKIHEHLIEINGGVGSYAISRAQLWFGLVLRAQDPMQFILGLEAATVVERREAEGELLLVRELDFGGFTVSDRVQLWHERESRTTVAASERWPASSMSVQIEEPTPGQLFLRFTYEANEPQPQTELDAMSVQLRRQAYEQADLDTARRIRQWAEAGALGEGRDL